MKLLRVRPYLAAAVLVVATGALLLGCGSVGGDQNTFNPSGDVAETQKNLFLLVLIPAVIILVLVGGALTYALIRYRRRRDDEPLPKQVHGNTRLELAWTIAPTVLLVGLAVPTIIGIVELGQAPGEDALRVTVIGQQFSWRFEYPDITDAEGNPLSSEELHIPVDQEVGFSLESLDVIHSFWAPKLAGKQDVVPGRTNQLVFTAEEPGVFAGQCAEFCGLQHAFMKFTVIAEEPEEFDAWVDEQLAAAAAAEQGAGSEGG